MSVAQVACQILKIRAILGLGVSHSNPSMNNSNSDVYLFVV